jgi:nucleotide-binding universal stress UspA family protein
MHTILIPVDESQAAMHAVLHAIATIKEGLVADIHVLNVQPPILTFGEFPVYDFALVEKAQKHHAKQVLAVACKALDQAGLKHTQHSEIGLVAPTIIEYAQQHHCDMIIMGTRGMGAFGNLVLGSTANQVVHQAKIPVTLIK